MRSHPVLHWTWRTAVGLTGGLILLAGLVMCVTPGPGLAGIILGLAILATEFAWAHGLLRRARRWAHGTKERALDAGRRARKRVASDE
ncbi:PGPGW domain-containing protein [Allosalinactinospora lopnorensis]|uniref:PGPGW domain-containing protein n=1 Tax=Allosalinactinospora lopnorensis TaxID=1352348 RepID=UPI000623ED63|nr:PGPGW domain-containing protein [Allosalinactinospora lopnorensis]